MIPTQGVRASRDDDIGVIQGQALRFGIELEKLKRSTAPDFPWYPYSTISNFTWFDQLLHHERRKLFAMLGKGPVLDVGAADGDLAFFIESQGFPVHAIDNGPTNFNRCHGIRRLKEELGSQIEIREVDLDSQFRLPAPRYSFVFLLGILYHLKNPYFMLETLARSAPLMMLSTRITRFNVRKNDRSWLRTKLGNLSTGRFPLIPRVDLRPVPVAYLVDPKETNNDATNFWIFSDAGLRRILARTGWDILEYMTVGATEDSDPASQQGDERAFCLLRSQVAR